MIVWTDYDPDTTILARCAESFATEIGGYNFHLLGPPDKSQAAAVQQMLSSDNIAPFFFFGHGEEQPPEWYGQGHSPMIGNGTLYLLQGRLIYATCCHSIEGIGQSAANLGATIVGYNGVLYILRAQQHLNLFKECILAGPRLLLKRQPAYMAKEASEKAYSQLADQLTASPNMDDQVLAVFAAMNADAVGLVGNAQRFL
jgi:hypothetical protein